MTLQHEREERRSIAYLQLVHPITSLYHCLTQGSWSGLKGLEG
jgi:hypothetical protein